MDFSLPLVGPHASIRDVLDLMNRLHVWGAIIRIKPDELRLVDYRDLIDAPDPSLPCSGADSEPILFRKELPDPRAIGMDRFKDAVISKRQELAVLDLFENNAQVFSISERLAAIYTGTSPGKRCTRPNKPAGITRRQWYHYYPPMSASAAGTCAVDGSALK